MKTKSLILILISLLMSSYAHVVSAQNTYKVVDSVVYRPAATVDSTLVGRDLLLELGVRQSAVVDSAMRAHLAANPERGLSGYRIRIFFDNKQTARAESEVVLKKFESLYHDVVAYRTYANPYFKVTVGDFRTKSEAMAHLDGIKKNFPSAFVVKENISYPVVDKENSFVVDTVKVLRTVSR